MAAMSQSGVVGGTLNQLNPTLDASGRNAVIDTGNALIRGFIFENTSSTSTSIPAASGQGRIDRLVLRLNRAASTVSTFIVPTVVTGTPAGSPVEPALTRTTTGLWDLPVCSWTSASNGGLTGLTDERQFIGFFGSGVSGSRPVLTVPGLFYQTDTGQLMLFDGSKWTVVGGTGDTWHKITNFSVRGWSGLLAYSQISPGLVSLACSVTMTSGANNSDGTVICSIAGSHAPATYKPIPMRCDALKISPQSGTSYETASLSVRADGTVAVFGVGNAATVLEGSGSYPLGI